MGNDDMPQAASESGKAKGSVTESKSFRDGLIYLYKRADYRKPVWLCRVKIPGSKGYVTRSTGTGDEHRAFKFADNLYDQMLAKSLTGGVPVSKRTGSLIDAYIERLEPEQAKRSIKYKILLMQRVKPFLTRIEVEDINTATITRLIDDQTEKSRVSKLSPNTVKRMFSDLKHFFNWCVEEGHLTEIPRFPKTSTDPARRPHFNAKEWSKLISWMGPYLRNSPKYVRRDRHLLMLYILILAETGIRVGEARELRWRDLRPIDNPEQPVAHTIALMVKGKTGIREVVASSKKVREALHEVLKLRRKDLKDENSDIFEEEDVPTDSFIFCDKSGKPIQTFKKSFATFLREINLLEDTFGQTRTLYSLRHTYATSRLEAGVNHYALAKNMGTSVAMLERFYGHTTNASMAEELTKPKKKRAEGSKDAGGELAWLAAT